MSPGPQQNARDQIERLLAAVGDDEIVARRRQTLRARLFQQIAPQRFVAAGRPELQDVRQIVPRQHGFATGAEIVQREEIARRPRHHEADFASHRRARCREGIAAIEQRSPIHGLSR